VFIAGQVAEDARGDLVGRGDLAAQSRQAFANLGRALASTGARPDQVAKITILVAGYRREDLPAIEQGRVSLFGDHRPADTLFGMATLSDPEYLIEVDAIAVLDADRVTEGGCYRSIHFVPASETRSRSPIRVITSRT
jgi:enamine deaminase RidA (YjgF/YER057c/UK114 family)